MIFNRLPEFEKELKRLAKKWRSLSEDVRKAEIVIKSLYVDIPGFNRDEARANLFTGKRAAILKQDSNYEAVKMRLDCTSLGSKDALRLVFTYVYSGETCTLVELFSKTDKAREDSIRLQVYIDSLPKPKLQTPPPEDADCNNSREQFS